jgi:hypothetical protein
MGRRPAWQGEQFFNVQDGKGTGGEHNHGHRAEAAVEFAAETANAAGLQALAGPGARHDPAYAGSGHVEND